MTEKLGRLTWDLINLMIGISAPIPFFVLILLAKEIMK